jgi:membrane fusion protein, multidrug efflux system
MAKKNNRFLPYAFLILIAALGYFYFSKFRNLPQNNAQANQPMAMPVDVMIAQKQPVETIIELPARISGYKISQVRPQASGVIKKRNFVEGNFVKEGQQLYQIDSVIYEANYKKAKTNLKAVRAKRDRYKNLLEQEAISKQEFEDLEASLAQAESEYHSAKENFNYTKVYAPISGYVGKSNFTEGTLVSANQVEPLTTISSLDPIYADISQSSSEGVLLRKQKNIKVTLVVGEKEFEEKGELKMVESFVSESTDSIQLRALFSNKNQQLLPGMFATAKLHLPAFDAITIPQRAAVRNSSGNLTIWIVEGNVAKMRQIKAEKTINDNWIVEEGLNEGEIVIIQGTMKIFEGANVIATVKNDEAKEGELK